MLEFKVHVHKVYLNFTVSEREQSRDWAFAMKFCEKHISSYLLGEDLLLTNPIRDCENLKRVSTQTMGPNWIAVARQTYNSIDQGK